MPIMDMLLIKMVYKLELMIRVNVQDVKNKMRDLEIDGL